MMQTCRRCYPETAIDFYTAHEPTCPLYVQKKREYEERYHSKRESQQ